MRDDTGTTVPEMRYELASDESVTEAIVTAVSEFSDIDPIPADGETGESMEPLYHAIDPDALESLLDRNTAGSGQEIEVSFQYMGYEITVSSAGEIGIARPGVALC